MALLKAKGKKDKGPKAERLKTKRKGKIGYVI